MDSKKETENGKIPNSNEETQDSSQNDFEESFKEEFIKDLSSFVEGEIVEGTVCSRLSLIKTLILLGGAAARSRLSRQFLPGDAEVGLQAEAGRGGVVIRESGQDLERGQFLHAFPGRDRLAGHLEQRGQVIPHDRQVLPQRRDQIFQRLCKVILFPEEQPVGFLQSTPVIAGGLLP